MGQDHHRSRNPKQGLVLIIVLAGVMLIAALAGTMRARASATMAVLSRFEEGHRIALAEQSVLAMVQADWAKPTITPRRPAGDPITLSRDGWRWQVRVSDVEGLVDLYTAPAPVLGLLPGMDGPAMAAAQRKVLTTLEPGTRHLSAAQTMAAMGLDPATRERLAPFVTQRARTGEINADIAPPELAADARLLAERDIAGGDLAEITLRRLP
ncbi:MAG: hypothetical protein RLZZ563_1662 [Pseudomonadota bacterium]